MSIGYLLLYGALALVALWLVAELLLQNRAPLLWRAVALGGFLCVVAGMRLRSVAVIGAGAAGFALGQVFVTLSVKRGRAVGWSLRRADGSLPGPLGKVPLLSAATGGAAVAAEAVEVEQVGEVGPIEVEETPAESGYAYEEVQELASDGVYAEAYYQQQPEQVYYQPEYQQAGYGDQQWHQQQPAYGQTYAQPQYQDPPPASGWGDPHAQPQYQQDPYAAQQAWEYQQQYGAIPQQQTYDQQQAWGYQNYQQQG